MNNEKLSNNLNDQRLSKIWKYISEIWDIADTASSVGDDDFAKISRLAEDLARALDNIEHSIEQLRVEIINQNQ